MFDIDTVKLIARITTMVGSGKIVQSIIANNVPMNTLGSKIIVRSTGFVIGGMLTELTNDFTDRKIDEMRDIFNGKKKVTL